MPTKAELTEQIKTEIQAGRAILAAADDEKRQLTSDEQTAAKAHAKEAERLIAKRKQLANDEAVRAAIRSLDEGSAPDGDGPAWARKQRPTSAWSVKTAQKIMAAHRDSDGRKAIVSGGYQVESPLQPGIEKLPEYPMRLLDVLINRKPLATGNVFEWLQQTVRTHNAGPVADNAVKPTSIYSFGEKEDRVRVIAHLSEAIPLRLADDVGELQGFLETEMQDGLFHAVESQVMSGDGTGENMTGLINTSGVVTQAWSTNLLTTLRKASTKLELLGEQPSAWAINPTDVETLDLLSDANARMYFDGPAQQLSAGAPVWSLPIVRTVAVPAGKAILGDWNRMQLVVREDSKLDIDTGGELFKRNQFMARMEGRYGVAVLRPSAFCLVSTASS